MIDPRIDDGSGVSNCQGVVMIVGERIVGVGERNRVLSFKFGEF